ncbi:MAG: NADH-quinone oxidoreductase subunit L [Verrucomicrobiota bacterium]
MDVNTIAWTILLLPLLVAASILLGVKRWAGLSSLVSTGSALITLILCAVLTTKGDLETVSFAWIDMGKHLQIDIGFILDDLARGMMLIVTSIGFLVHLFSLGYMKDEPGKARYFAGLSLFMFSMTGIVLADNFIMMFIFWELVGISSYILIGHWFEKDSAADAAKKAFLTNRIGDFGFMIGILLVWSLTGSIYFDEIAAAVGGVTNLFMLNAAVLCVFCGAVGKSAQIPLHVWLPDAMEGPTPVSALIHAATMVAAGVYMLARVSFLVGGAETAATVIAWIGAITALVAALMALQQNDIKRILAYSTLSQLGYMVMAQGVPGGSEAGMFHLYTHAFFKALLFLGSGAVIYACHHQQDIWKMGGLRSKLPITFVTFAIGTSALIAVPLTSGFWSKEGILESAHYAHMHGPYLMAMAVAFLTPFYMTRLVIVAFFGKNRTEDANHAKEVGPIMWVPLGLLAVMAIFSAYDFFTKPLLATGHADFKHLLGHLFSLTPILSLVGLITGVTAAILIYKGRDSDPIQIKVFANRFYIDEFYERLVRFFQDGLGKVLDWTDRKIIDPLVARFPAMTAMTTGSILRVFQMGNVQSYAFMFALALIALILFLIF